IALLAPDDLPSSSGRTAERTRFATGAKKSAIPTPATMKGPISSAYGVVGVVTEAIQASAPACIARPTPIRFLAGILSESAPASGAMNIGASVQGSIGVSVRSSQATNAATST